MKHFLGLFRKFKFGGGTRKNDIFIEILCKISIKNVKIIFSD